MDWLLPSEVRLVASQHERCGVDAGRRDHDGSPGITPHKVEAAVGSRGPRPHAGLKARRLFRCRVVGDLPSPYLVSLVGGIQADVSLSSWSADRTRSSSRRLASAGFGKVVMVVFELGGPVDRSLRRRGQHLVVVGALLGTLIGTALGLIAEDAQTSTAVAASGPARGAALAARPPSSHPPASRAAGSWDGNDSSGNQRAEPPGRPDKRMATRKRIGQAVRTSPARARARTRAGARASSTPDRSRTCSSPCWRKRRRSISTSATASSWSAYAWCSLGRDSARAEASFCRTRKVVLKRPKRAMAACLVWSR